MAQTEATRPIDQALLHRVRFDHDPDFAARFVDVPDRNGERCATATFQPDHSDVNFGEECLAFFLGHGT